MKFKLSKRHTDTVTNDDSAPLAEKKKREKKPKLSRQEKLEIKAKKSKQPKQKKVKQVSASKLLKAYQIPKINTFILSIGDEGIILTYLKNRQVEGRWFAASATEENFVIFSKAISTDNKARMLIVLDTMDQVYSQQTLPPVSKMSLAGLLKRRIKREFGDATLKGSYLLERSDTKEWNFMIFAIEQQEEVAAWLNWAAEQPVCPLGIRILPLEITNLADTLYKTRAKLAEETELTKEREWRFLVSYNKVSGFRQVIIRRGKMIFTRLSQPIDGGEDVQAGIIEQEVSSTIEYLKRIGLSSHQDIHLNVIASQDIIDRIDPNKISVPSHEFFSPYSIGQKFSWNEVTQPDDRFGDVFLGVFCLVNKKSIAKLWTKPLEKFAKIYKISPILRISGILLVVGSIGYSVFSGYEWWENSDAIEQTRMQSNRLTNDLEKTKTTIDMPPEELDRALEMFDLYKNIKQNELTPRSFFIDLASAFANMPKDMRIKTVEWNETSVAANNGYTPPLGQNPNGAPIPTGKPVKVSGILNIKINVPVGIKSEALAKRANGIIEKLQTYFKYYTITLKDIPGVNSTNDTLNINLNKTEQQQDGFEILVLNAMFEGTEYIPELTFDK